MCPSKTPPSDAIIVADPNNEYLSIQVGSDCHFNSGATGVITGSIFNISYKWPDTPGTSFTTVKVDDVPYVFGYPPEAIVQPPTDLSNLINESVCQYGPVEVKQTLEIVVGSSTGRPDTGMYKYTVTNNDTVAHNVGIRIMIDTMLQNNDGAPFRLPSVGAVTSEMEFLEPSIPQYWQAFYSLSDPDIMAQGTLVGGGATTPDRFVLSDWPRIYFGNPWDFSIDPGISVTNDSAATLWWNPVLLTPGETREFVTFYGLGTLSGTADLSITGPAALSVVGGVWSPSPFIVTAYLTNNTGAPLTDVPVDLILPAGLDFAPGETATHTIPVIAPDETGQTSWNVVPVIAGDWEYSVTALGQTANRTVSVPPLQLQSCFLNEVIVSSDSPLCETNFDNNYAQVCTPIDPESAALTVTKTGPTTVCAGTPITYEVIVANDANRPKETTLTDTILGPNVTISNVSAPPIGSVIPSITSTSGGVIITWTGITIPSKDSTSVDIIVTTDCSNVGTLTDTAVATLSGTPIPSNTVTTFVIPAVDLSVTKALTSPTGTVYVGDEIVYTISVTNNGPCNATGIYVEDTVDATATVNLADNPGWVSLGSNTYRYTIGDLAAGDTIDDITFKVIPTVAMP